MIIKIDFMEKRTLYIPDGTGFEIIFNPFPDCEDEHSLMLITNEKEYIIMDDGYFFWRYTEENCGAEAELIEEVYHVINQKIEENPTLKVLDIAKIQNELYKTKYEPKWEKAGFFDIKD